MNLEFAGARLLRERLSLTWAGVNARSILIGALPVVILVASPERVGLSLAISAAYLIAAIWICRPSRADRAMLFYVVAAGAFTVFSLARADFLDSLTADQRAYAASKAFYFVAAVLPLSVAVAMVLPQAEAIKPAAVTLLAMGMAVAAVAVALRSDAVLGAQRYAWEGNLVALGFLVAAQLWLIRNVKVVAVLAALAVGGIMFAGARQSVVVMVGGLLAVAVYWIIAEFVRARSWRRALLAPRVLVASLALAVQLAAVYVPFFIFGPLVRLANGDVKNPCHCITYRVAEVFSDPAGRDTLVKAGLHIFAAHPLFGAGLGGFAGVVKGYDYPHSIVLEVGAELGLVGLAIFFVPLLAAVVRLARAGIVAQSQSIATLLALVLGYFVIANLSGDIPSARAFWIFAIVVMKLGFDRAAVPKAGIRPSAATVP